jgi:dTDP-glucose 4,6-dehydratase
VNRLAADLDRTMTHDWLPWQELRGARVFVTGATGFFGCWLLETFVWANDRLDLGASLVALTRDPRGFARRVPHLASHTSVTLHEGDVRGFAFPDGAFTHVMHAAADAAPPVTAGDRQRVFDVIVDGTRRALELARNRGARRFLFTSSGAVYGRQPADVARVPEHFTGGPDPVKPEATGAEAKRAAEALCAIHASATLQPVIARCFAFVGPYLPLDGKFAAGNFIHDALAGGPIIVAGDGRPVRSYLYAADLAAWLWAMLLRGEPLRPYNVGSEVAITIEELAQTVASRFSPRPVVRVNGQVTQGGGGDRYVPSTARAREELGVKMTVGLDEAIARTVEWHAAA